MKLFLSTLLLATAVSFATAQTDEPINITDLVRDTQQWKKVNNRMSFAWWIPTEYWEVVLRDNKQVPPEAIAMIQNVFKDYLMIWACDLEIEPTGSMTFTVEEEIRKTILVVDAHGQTHLPLTESQVGAEPLAITENIKPMLAQAIGQMGKGLHYYFFKIKDEKGANVINATQHGEFTVVHSNSEFHWKLPLPTLMPPKFCPVDKEKMKGNWIYCPVHGQKLE